MSTLERWEPQWRFLDRWMVKTGFCQRQFRQTNEHQHYLNKKLNSELHGEVDFRLQAFLSAVCEHDVQSFSVARWKDFLPHSEYKGQMSVKYKKNLDNKPFTLLLYSISFFGINNKKMGHLEIFCLCFLYCQGVLHSRGPITQ